MKNPKSKFTLKQSRHSRFGLSSLIFSPEKHPILPSYPVQQQSFAEKGLTSTDTFSEQIFTLGTLIDGDYIVVVVEGSGNINPFSFNPLSDTQGNIWDNVGQYQPSPWGGLASHVYSVWKCDRYSGDGSLTINTSSTLVIGNFNVFGFQFTNGSTNAFVSQSSTFNNLGNGPNAEICNIATVVNDLIWVVLCTDNGLGGNATGSPLAINPSDFLFWVNNQSLIGSEIIDTGSSVSGNWAGIGSVFQCNNP